MPLTYKDDMLKIVKAKFELLSGHEPFVLKSINKKWCNWKSVVKSLNFDPNIPIKQQMLDIPDRVDEKHTRLLADGSDASEIIHEAIVRTIKLIANQEPKNSNGDYVPSPNDSYAKIMCKDKHGHVRMNDLGVTPGNIYGVVPSSDANYRLAKEYKSKYLHAMEKYDALYEKLENLLAIVHGRTQPDAYNVPIVSPNNQCSFGSTSRPIHEIIAIGYVSEMNSALVNGEEVVSDCDLFCKGCKMIDFGLTKILIKKEEASTMSVVVFPFGYIAPEGSMAGNVLSETVLKAYSSKISLQNELLILSPSSDETLMGFS
ncbi:hypothetical protein BUALT_Bualt05G0095100 [Buddleja alternifolia]|uniref:Uncharacterized protein n=1 Tax=Buddleja alternifolia TaxID=168488 RepID=A0AAV6XRB7_9LAMI|nr:hypothetical protein BUALT_Bualt05G0095100 [Buddleja alternifolia]